MSTKDKPFVITRPTSLSPEDTEDAIRILRVSLGDNIVMQAVGGYDPEILETVFKTRLEASAPLDALWIARSPQGKLLGVMITNLPGKVSGASASIPTKETHPWREAIAKEHRDWLDNEFYPTFEAFNLVGFGPNGYKKDVYVNLLSVSPDSRKQGIGKALMDEAWKEAEKTGIRCSLITQGDSNVRYYSSMGYKTTHSIDVDFKGETIRSYAMVKNPISPRSSSVGFGRG